MTETVGLTGGLVMASADSRAEKADIVIRDGKILALGRDLDLAAHRVTRNEDVSGKLILPGFVNTHYHSHDRWDRGRFSTMPLEVWMSLYNPPTYGRGWTPDEIYLRTLLGGMELIRGGATAVLDDVHLGMQIDDASIDAVFRAYADLGMRADVGIAYSDLPGHETIPYLDDLLPEKFKTKGQIGARSRDEMLGVWTELAQRHSGRVRSAVSISGPQRCTVEFQQQAQELARGLNRPVLTHVLETRIQAMTAHKFYGQSMIEHMDQIGVLDAQTVVIHGVWQTGSDLDIVAGSGAGVSHNPVSNTKLGSGIAPVMSMLKRGIPVGLGTDNHNANDSCSMFEAVKFGNLLQPLLHEDFEDWPDARASLRMASEHGAALMRQEDRVGRLEPGYEADFLCFDLAADGFFPLNNPAAHAVYADSRGALRDVWVAGAKVLAEQKIATVDEAAIRAEIKGRVKVIQKKVLGGVPDSAEMEQYLVAAYRKCMDDPLMEPYLGRVNCCPRH